MQYLPNERAKEIALSLIPEIEADSRFAADIEKKGVMFGVLVCKSIDEKSSVGASEIVLKAFSGQISGSWEAGDSGETGYSEWCPPLLDISLFDKHIAETDAEIHRLTDEIEAIEKANPNLKGLGSMSGRVLSPEEKATFQKILSLKEKRRELSKSSMEKIFSFYTLHCVQGANPTVGGDSVRKMQFSFRDIFGEKLPPTGTGECCAPKLLNRAAVLKLQPVSMCEFFLGKEGTVQTDVSTTLDMTKGAPLDMTRRRNRHFYDPCDEKCKPLMKYLLGLDIVYFDKDIIVVDKPSGLLSVPGRGEDKQDCVVNRVKFLFSEYMKIDQPSVHRLDMDTSGLLVLAFTAEAHRNLNRQFEEKTVEKKYIAVLSREPREDAPSRISLPFRVDIDNRPHQIYDPVYGKMGITNWKRIGTTGADFNAKISLPDGVNFADEVTHGGFPIVEFIPETGRTHQLRVCAASELGLDAPILGDDLYGKGLPHSNATIDSQVAIQDSPLPILAPRLMLHACELSFSHPSTGERLHFFSDAKMLL